MLMDFEVNCYFIMILMFGWLGYIFSKFIKIPAVGLKVTFNSV